MTFLIAYYIKAAAVKGSVSTPRRRHHSEILRARAAERAPQNRIGVLVHAPTSSAVHTDCTIEIALCKPNSERRRADSNRFPHLITSDNSGVAGVCTGLQIPHI